MGLLDFLRRIVTENQGDDSKKSKSARKLESEIMKSGTIWHHKLWRRWVMGQMFHMLTWGEDKTLRECNYDRRLSRCTIRGAMRIAEHEQKMQQLLLKNDDLEELNERRRWYSEALLRDVRKPSGRTQEVLEAFKEGYKGTGAYFTMKNLIMFHGCCFFENGIKMSTDESLSYLKTINFNPDTTANQLFALMLKLISDNNYIYDCARY